MCAACWKAPCTTPPVREDYADTRELEALDTFAEYQAQVNDPRKNVVSHSVIRQYIADNGQDYRFETAPHPVEALRCRTRDNIKIGRAAAVTV